MRNKLLLISAFAFTIYSCGKSRTEKSNSLATAAETKSNFNNTSFGVYKGTIVGSSGYIVFRINNGDDVVKGTLKIDGKEDILTTKEKLIAGQPIINVLFSGQFSSMRLSADADGSNAQLTDIKIEGHKYAGGYLSHENSNQQVLVYEGRFTGVYSGTINLARVGIGQYDSIFTLMKVDGDTMLFTGHGFNGDSLRLNIYSHYGEMKFVGGKIPGTGTETIDGAWYFEEQMAGTFTFKRTY